MGIPAFDSKLGSSACHEGGGAPDGASGPLGRLISKLSLLAGTIDDMSDEAFGSWVNALPEDEFFEFIGLDLNGSFKTMLTEYGVDITANAGTLCAK